MVDSVSSDPCQWSIQLNVVALLIGIAQVVRYDDGRYEVLQEVRHLEEYIAQNSSRDIQRRREVRMALRALEGQRVVWPYEDKTVCCFTYPFNRHPDIHCNDHSRSGRNHFGVVEPNDTT